MTDTVNIETVTASGTEIFVPLNKLKKSPRNAGRPRTARRISRPWPRASP